MTTNFKDRGVDVDQRYINKSAYILGGSLVVSGAANTPWRANSYFFSNWKEPYIGEDLGWYAVSGKKSGIGGSYPATSAQLYAIKPDGIYFWGLAENYKIPGLANGSSHTSSSPLQILSGSWLDVQVSDLNTFAIKSDNTLWGNGEDSMLGVSPLLKHSTSSWSIFPPDRFFKSFVADINNALGNAFGIDVSGAMWAVGSADQGILGDGTNVSKSSWVQIGSGNTWSSLADKVGICMMAIDTSGRLWTWGSNSAYGCGTGAASTISYSTPVQVGTATNWTQISLSDEHSVGLRSPGLLYVWGTNNDYQLLDGSNKVGKSTPIQIGTLSSWIWVSAGKQATSAIRWSPTMAASGLLVAGGNQTNGQLGNGVITGQVSTPIVVGANNFWMSIKRDIAFNYALASDALGRVYGMGQNDYGQLGNGSVGNASTPVLTIGVSPILYYNTQNAASIFGVGLNIKACGVNYGMESFYSPSVTTPTNIGTISSGSAILYANRGFYLQNFESGSARLYTGGVTTCIHYGHAQNPTYYHTSSFVQIGSYSWLSMAVWSNHGHFIRSDNTLWAFGTSSTGSPIIGNGSDVAAISSLTQIASSNTWSKIAGSYSHKLALDTSGRLWTWGNNTSGQLGDATTTSKSTPILISSKGLFDDVFISPGYRSYAKNSAGMWTWGYGTTGLRFDGLSTAINKTTPVLTTGWGGVSWSMLHGTTLSTAAGIANGIVVGVGICDTTNNQFGLDRSGYVAMTTVSSPVQISGKNRWVDVQVYDGFMVGILAGGED